MLTRKQIENVATKYFEEIDCMPNNTQAYESLVKLLGDMAKYDIIDNDEKEIICEVISKHSSDNYNYFNNCYRIGDGVVDMVVEDIETMILATM